MSELAHRVEQLALAASAQVDFVLSDGRRTLATEVGSGRVKPGLPGLETFAKVAPGSRALLVGAQGLPLEQVLNAASGDLLAG